jgi:uncharacterized membrane protein
MSDIPVELIVAAFNSPDGAGKAMAALKLGKKEKLIAISDAAVVVKDANGKLKVTDAKRRSTKGLVTGGLIGGVIGLLAGPVGWWAVGGGVIGALAGKVAGSPLKAEMKGLGEALAPGTSAIVAVIDHVWVAQIEAELAAEGARVVADALKADIAAQLAEGGNVLYTAKSSGGTLALGRVAETPGQIAVSSLTASDEGVELVDAVITQDKLEDAAS